ncbi:MAG TPA: translation initiation factor IF-2 [Bacillota bacterium]|nr:translation initiation factor IF-2 [Bacillota bacterium]
MSNMRVYEYAREHDLTSREVLQYLEELNIEITNHMATIDSDIQKQLDDMIYGEADTEDVQVDKVAQEQEELTQVHEEVEIAEEIEEEQEKSSENVLTYTEPITVEELAEKLEKDVAEIIKNLMFLGVMATKNQNLDDTAVELICEEYGYTAQKEEIFDETDLYKYISEDKSENLVERPSVVTIMGHVDHGKTTLLDAIRKTKVTEGEAGGITQHIGAYQIETSGKKITFLDTPGHEAFTSMRSRGAQVTDIAILVVAADDGVMPQTVEAINHAKEAGVPIIVAVNKMDLEEANPDRVMQELTEYELVAEDWGGDTIFVQMSARQGDGIDDLLEMILLVAEMEELKANPNKEAFGTVIDAELDRGRGSVASLLIQNGTLRIGDPLVIGNTYGKVRAMVNDLGQRIEEAGPSTPVEITGLNDVPEAGDQFLVFAEERKARQIGMARERQQIEEERSEKSRISLDDLFEQIKQGDMKEIKIIIKADVRGSAEALASSLQKIEVENVKVQIIHIGVGAITESDIILASASNAIVIGFNVRPDVNAQKAAQSEGVDVRLHRVIYQAIEEVEAAMKGLLDPEYEEKVIGQAEVRETFHVSRIGTIAGCYVTDGKIQRDAGIRLIRNGVVQHEGEILDLKRFQDDVREVTQNYECGITIKDYNDIKEGDIIEAFIMEEIERV